MVDRRTARLNARRQEFEKLSKDELIDLLMQAYGLIDGGTPREFPAPTSTRQFDQLDPTWEAEEYIRLPADTELTSKSALKAPWYITLVSYDLSHPILGIELVGDVVVGRGDDNAQPDLDLTVCNALGYGVSRQHALLHPTNEELQMMDLGSTNGTRHNGEPLEGPEPVKLENNDIIAFGTLRFQVRIVERPN